MILKGASGAEAELPISLFDSSTQLAITGHVWTTGELKLATAGGTLANATVANVVEKGMGKYALQMTAGETGTAGAVYLVLDTTNGYLPHSWEETVIDIGGVTRDALLNYAFRTGRTVRGLLRRLDAMATNKVTGLIGALVTWYQPDGATVEYSVAQDVPGGNRSTGATVTNSETP